VLAAVITKKVAEFIVGARTNNIPAKAMELAKLGITDFCGVALAGSKEPQSRFVMDYTKKMGGNSQASVIGGSYKTSIYQAALANGTSGHALDYDDIAVSLVGHPSVFLAPAILATAEQTGASGEDLLTAYVLGYETACQIAVPILQSHYVQGWHSTANFGTLGATAAVCWLLKLNQNQVQHALGIAASLAGGLRQNFGTMTKPLHAGKAAANGVQAALLASSGFTADENIIDAPMGFARTFGHSGEVDWGKVADNLGKNFLITSAEGLEIKPYPSCGFTHCAIDMALKIKRDNNIDSDNITGIELGVTPFDKQILIHHRPKTGLEGKFSLEYCVARALVSGAVQLKHFDEQSVTESGIAKLIEKMTWNEKFPMPQMGGTSGMGFKSVTVKLKNGQTFSGESIIAKGMPANPLSEVEFDTKFLDCASVALTQGDADKALLLLKNIKNENNISPLMNILVG